MDQEQLMNLLTLVCLSLAAYLIVKDMMQTRRHRRSARQAEYFAIDAPPANLPPPQPNGAQLVGLDDPVEAVLSKAGLKLSHFTMGCENPAACEMEQVRIRQEMHALGLDNLTEIIRSRVDEKDAFTKIQKALHSVRMQQRSAMQASHAEQVERGGNSNAEKRSFLSVEKPRSPLVPSAPKIAAPAATLTPAPTHNLACGCVPKQCMKWNGETCEMWECAQIHCEMEKQRPGAREGFCMDGLCSI